MGKITTEILDVIRQTAAVLQRAPLREEVKIRGTIRGGYHNAVIKAGLLPYGGENRGDIRPPVNGKYYTDEELIGFVHEYVKTTGKVPQRGIIPEYGYIEYRFGSWASFMKQLGYDYVESNAFKPITRSQKGYPKAPKMNQQKSNYKVQKLKQIN